MPLLFTTIWHQPVRSVVPACSWFAPLLCSGGSGWLQVCILSSFWAVCRFLAVPAAWYAAHTSRH